jgi:hypothetical protein
MKRSFIGVAMVAACASLSGCVDMGEVQALRDKAASLESRLDDDIAQRRATLARLDQTGVKADDPIRQKAAAELEGSRASRAAVDAAVKQVDLVLNEAKNPGDPISVGVGALAPFLPEPSRTPLVLGGALLVTLLRARQTKTALVSVAKGLDKAMQTDEAFKQRFEANAGLFRAVQTPAAKRVVDEATTDGFMVRLPV